MKNEAEVIIRLKSYGQLWNGWTYNGKLYGSGGSGCVLGLSRGDKRSVVKIIYIEDNQMKYSAVKDEIETMATLRSEYLVECLDYRIEEVFNRKGEKIGYDFLIHMNEYEPFSEFLREEDYYPNELCLQLARDIGGALCVLHSNGILHRDIKPENIFIDNSSGERHFRLGDFGVSKRIGDMSGLTTTGTLNFMAPESFKYYEYSYRSDIYNLGMTLYYILNDLRFPVFSEEESQSDFDYNTDCRLHGEKLPKPMYGSEELIQVVIRCCEANPKDRYKDISEMLNDLFGQNIPYVGVKLKNDLSAAPRKKEERKKHFRIASVVLTAVLVAGVMIYAIFAFQRKPEQSSILKYNSSDISSLLYSVPEQADYVFQTINQTDTDSYDFKLDRGDFGTIIHMPGKALNKNYSGDCIYECYSYYEEMIYIFSEQGDSSYRFFLQNDDIVCVVVGGENILTYNYGDERITDEYYEIVEKAKECYSEIDPTVLVSY